MSQTRKSSKPLTAAESVTGVQLMQGQGVQPSKGFWGDAWSQVIRRPGAIVALSWIGIVVFFACFSPIIASGHPIRVTVTETGESFSPLLRTLTTADILLLLGGASLVPWILIGKRAGGDRGGLRAVVLAMLLIAAAIGVGRLAVGLTIDASEEPQTLGAFWGGASHWLILALVAAAWMLTPLTLTKGTHLRVFFFAAIQAGIITVLVAVVSGMAEARDAPDWVRHLQRNYSSTFAPVAATIIAILASLPFLAIPTTRRITARVPVVAAVCLATILAGAHGWSPSSPSFTYMEREQAGQIEATYTIVPWSPTQRRTDLFLKDPGTTFSEATGEEPPPSGDPRFIAGTDALGQDVLSQMLHASRLSISIGLVSTGIAVTIGVTLGALMGYFGGWVDMALYRVVEIFMSIPVLFLLIVAAGVLPRNTYIIMAIIGMVTWTNFARYTRAEFYKLRNQDFVQSARAVGLPLPSVLFKHMLPNGVTPVLVESSFAIAVAIQFEATLSFLGLGPADQPSWGRLLSEASTQVGAFIPHLALIPGVTITVTVLSLVIISEALRDAIDPKLKKARV